MPEETLIEFNEQFSKALHLLQHGSGNLFVTGKAGTGKSTLLRYFRAHTVKKLVVLAPTGVAALNVQGETIHSFFRFKPGLTPDKVRRARKKDAELYKALEIIVIDEASMVRADLMDCVDAFMRLNGPDPLRPFGGVQVALFGDLYQLPPVVTGPEREIFSSFYAGPYFFNANVFKKAALEYLELEKIYRQKDQGFIDILNAIRNNSIKAPQLEALNKRVGADVEQEGRGVTVRLLTTNADAAGINNERLRSLDGRGHVYKAEITGAFTRESYPADDDLHLKAGAQVMLLNNDPHGRWVNGTMAAVQDIMKGLPGECDVVHVRLPDGSVEAVEPHAWELFHFTLDKEAGKIKTETAGTFTQYPLKLAWGITIHKSQGKTFDRAIIDLGRRAFAAGQTYVALSRCVSLEGLSLARAVRPSDVMTDWRIVRYVTGRQYGVSEALLPLAEKIKLIEKAIADGCCLEILYLKAGDEKSRRVVRPVTVGDCRFKESAFKGLVAECLKRGERRTFRVDRILEMKAVAEEETTGEL
ncbi:MAG: AAA family ATPase [Elusimicrobia bacterium GWB2_63_22]|nr:MAG: AAA family ATPase [Elusimicrobia bacterium GWB2_63_22]